MASSDTVNSFADIANAEFIRSLGKLSSERFTCGGALPKPSKIQVTYLNRDGQWNGVAFPGLQDTDILKLIESSSVAVFGKGKESVTDL